MDEAIQIATDRNNFVLLGASYLWLGIMATEKGEHSRASEFYSQALSYSTNLRETAKADLISRVTAYQAKNELAQRNYCKAYSYYQASIKATHILEDYKNLEYGEVYKGLSICCLKQGQLKDSKRYSIIAAHYLEKATVEGIKSNCLFSFIPKNCS